MPRRAYAFQIATQERVVLSADIVSLIAPGVEGQLGVLARHAPLLTELGVGQFKITYPDGTVEVVATTGGIMEVSEAGVIVLADAAERAGEIDVQRAEAARDRAEGRLRGGAEETENDVERARLALLRAINRLKTAAPSS
jgi:F-type H+-transporting ATPase subunit epsilon